MNMIIVEEKMPCLPRGTVVQCVFIPFNLISFVLFEGLWMLQGCKNGLTLSSICHSEVLPSWAPFHYLCDRGQNQMAVRARHTEPPGCLRGRLSRALFLALSCQPDEGVASVLFLLFSPFHSHFRRSEYCIFFIVSEATGRETSGF